jgi:hypothetical protein
VKCGGLPGPRRGGPRRRRSRAATSAHATTPCDTTSVPTTPHVHATTTRTPTTTTHDSRCPRRHEHTQRLRATPASPRRRHKPTQPLREPPPPLPTTSGAHATTPCDTGVTLTTAQAHATTTRTPTATAHHVRSTRNDSVRHRRRPDDGTSPRNRYANPHRHCPPRQEHTEGSRVCAGNGRPPRARRQRPELLEGRPFTRRPLR